MKCTWARSKHLFPCPASTHPPTRAPHHPPALPMLRPHPQHQCARAAAGRTCLCRAQGPGMPCSPARHTPLVATVGTGIGVEIKFGRILGWVRWWHGMSGGNSVGGDEQRAQGCGPCGAQHRQHKPTVACRLAARLGDHAFLCVPLPLLEASSGHRACSRAPHARNLQPRAQSWTAHWVCGGGGRRTFLATQQDSTTALYAAKSCGSPATGYSSNRRPQASISPPSASPRSTMFIIAQLTGWADAWRTASCVYVCVCERESVCVSVYVCKAVIQ